MRIRGLLAFVVVVGAAVTGCGTTVVAGTGGPGGTGGITSGSGPTSPVVEIPDCPNSLGTGPLDTAVPADDAAPSTPVGSPLITITQGTNSWVASPYTQPYDIAIYPDGTAIRTEEPGTTADPLPELTIGLLDSCLVTRAVAEFGVLAQADLGDPAITDQGITSVTVHDSAGDVDIDVYALGIGDEYVTGGQRDSRDQLTALIGELRDGMTRTATWVPDRIRVSLLGNPTDPDSIATWPLPGSIKDAVNGSQRVPCEVFDGADAAAIVTELGRRPAGSSWTDGTDTVVLAIGGLVPGQGCFQS
jgi:hypothetical protein